MAKRRVKPWPKEATAHIAVLKKCLVSTYLSLDMCIKELEKGNESLTTDLMPYLTPFLDDCMSAVGQVLNMIPDTRGQPPMWTVNISKIDMLILEIFTLLESAYKESKRYKPPVAEQGLYLARNKCREGIELIEEIPFNRSTLKPEAFRAFINTLDI